MITLTAEIRNQLLQINDEQIKMIKEIKEDLFAYLEPKVEETVEIYRNEIKDSYQEYFSAPPILPAPHSGMGISKQLGSDPITNMLPTRLDFDPDYNPREFYQILEQTLSEITEKLVNKMQTIFQDQFDLSIKKLEATCKKYDSMKEQTSARFCQNVKAIYVSKYNGKFDNKNMNISKMDVSLSGTFWFRNIFNRDYPLSKRIWNILRGEKKEDINLATEKTIAYLKETFSKQLSENMEHIFTPLLDSLTEQSKKIITNDYCY